MDEKYIEESVKEVIEELKKKIDTLSENCDEVDDSFADRAAVIKE